MSSISVQILLYSTNLNSDWKNKTSRFYIIISYVSTVDQVKILNKFIVKMVLREVIAWTKKHQSETFRNLIFSAPSLAEYN